MPPIYLSDKFFLIEGYIEEGPNVEKGEFMNEQMRVAREKAREILQQNGIIRAAFFGSIVRGELTDESDIDILVEFEGHKSLLDLAGLKLDLEDALERPVDLLTYRSIHPLLKERILAEQVPIL